MRECVKNIIAAVFFLLIVTCIFLQDHKIKQLETKIKMACVDKKIKEDKCGEYFK